jgi:hypothetical protein
MKKNKHAQALAKKRHLSLTPERRREIATLASKAAAKKRSEKLSTVAVVDIEPTLR